MKPQIPKILKQKKGRRTNPGRIAMGHVAFPGGDKAFQPPGGATAPEAFTAAQSPGAGLGPEPPSVPLPTVQG